MQSSQDEESPRVEDDNAPSHHIEAEWTGLSKNFTTAGYRDGISSKEVALQEGFDAAFARAGAPRGRELGVLPRARHPPSPTACPSPPPPPSLRRRESGRSWTTSRRGTGSPPADDLRALRMQLESVLLEAGVNVQLGLDWKE
ncbi:hypothetical protein EDB92DRAFT_1948874 [Lactarius akahatsu]|uniref:Uncharacterized protein n=1 Tax=Lactarius akahatsu TaxID=416441 RepID=A0AAD4QB44_9AGAM|nr:hypothetical protein EDB92DRAFT_1948874 [Lactarius akahatsu]